MKFTGEVGNDKGNILNLSISQYVTAELKRTKQNTTKTRRKSQFLLDLRKSMEVKSVHIANAT